MLDRLGQADRICGISALLALISTYLPWYHFHDAHGSTTVNAFGAGFLGDTLFFCAIATLLMVAMRTGLVDLRQTGLEDRHLLPVTGVALGAVILQLLIGVNGSGAFHSITIGVVVALLAAGGMVVGARMERQSGPGTHSLRRSSR
jgi:peptidoglycan/LPS O-acetylase OafA/YrhL